LVNLGPYRRVFDRHHLFEHGLSGGQ
jgi:hypothetical protein